MPVLDGNSATQRIRVWELEHKLRHIPIVGLTAAAFEEDKKRCLLSGMDDVLTKPVIIENLRNSLRNNLSR
jgi:CheY-like chemotaxis protein